MTADLVVANKAKERALVRLMVLEGGGKPDEKKPEPPPTQKPPEEMPQAEPPPAPIGEGTKDLASEAVEPVTESPSTKPAESAQASQPVPSERVSVEKLEIRHMVEGHLWEYQFIVKNIDPQGSKLKGYTFIVLEPQEGSEEPPAVSPFTPLKAGRPTIFKKGQYFSIARFKPVKGNFPGAEAIDPFETATVYVYSETGGLLLEQVFHVDEILKS